MKDARQSIIAKSSKPGLARARKARARLRRQNRIRSLSARIK